MGVIEDIADKLAVDTLAAADELQDAGLVDTIARTLEASSTAAHEAFMASVRARVALTRGRELLEGRLAAAKNATSDKSAKAE